MALRVWEEVNEVKKGLGTCATFGNINSTGLAFSGSLARKAGWNPGPEWFRIEDGEFRYGGSSE